MKLKDYIDEDNQLFEMSNLHKRHTGIDYTIWVSSKIGVKHGPRVKLSSKNNTENLDVVITVESNPTLLHGKLPSKVLDDVKMWIIKNEDVLIKYWHNKIDTSEMIDSIKRL